MSFFTNKPKLPAGVTKAKIVDESKIVTHDFDVIQVMANDGVNICSHACAVCWDTKLPDGYEDRSTYISKRTATGHSSVTEHSNHAFYLPVEKSEIEAMVEILDANRFLHTKVKFGKKYDLMYFVIGGSWRAWNYLLRNCNYENPILRKLRSAVYTNCDWSGFADLIKEGYIPNNFSNVNTSGLYDNTVNLVTSEPVVISNKLDCYGLDNINMLIKMITEHCPEPELFTIADMFEFCSCTILFKNMSRTGTHQLVRHRNAITQESQRYVNYADASFNSPAKFKDIYNQDYKYSITFGRSSQKMTLQEIGDNITKIYSQLSDKDKLGKLALLKEDARSYLPSSIQCRKIFITFTWGNLFHFLRLREDKHAQAEIRSYAIDIGNWFAEQYPEFASVYRKDAGDGSWVNYPLPNKNLEDDAPVDKESYIEVLENSMKTEETSTTEPQTNVSPD